MKTYKIDQLRSMNTTKYKFSEKSLNKLVGVNADLVDVIFKVSEYIDLTIISGYRTAEEQNALYKLKRSSKDGYTKKSKHQSGNAVDILPRPTGVNMYDGGIENDLRWAYFIGFFQAIALSMNIQIRTGWKWRTTPMDVLKRPLKDNSLPDANHLEILI